ncbi:hypothetical protein HJC23_013853 [Cyclotella cryptica]|uniref:DNA replication licensing factor MCM5 n=1 Tax=Cyclotella cryptica TaxID=29204 RepID=A0ABD3P9U5_9STRA|eukprot:CCRYP_016326-RB/>CCRYP_016326-RB protein AED:0.07 eAED:0.07 QI:144/1/1/1/1/1/6/107/906
MDFDEDRIYYSHQNLHQPTTTTVGSGSGAANGSNDRDLDEEERTVNLDALRRHFREFLRNYRQGPNRYIYRDRLLRMHRRHHSTLPADNDDDDPAQSAAASSAGGGGDWNPNKSYIHVDLAHVGEYDAALLGQLLSRPSEALPVFEVAAADALRTLTFRPSRTDYPSEEQPDGDAASSSNNNNPKLFTGQSIQILLRGNLTPTPLRSIQSHHMNNLLKCPGIIVSAARSRPRAMCLRIRCGKCMDVRTVFGNSSVSGTPAAGGSAAFWGSSSPFSGFSLPTRCLGPNPQECGPTPYAVLPDDSIFIDQQTLKLQEAPEMVPTGEMPRSVLVAVERGLVDKAAPGTRVTVLAIASLFTTSGGNGSSGGAGNKRSRDAGGGVKTAYLRVVGMEKESSTADSARFSPAEEEAFRQLSRRSDIYDILYRSIAPSISGSYTVDIKKAILCLLFGGSRKCLPDGMKLRGDINVLLLGDPSTAKSQFLKFATRVAPVGVYTSGKGSSAAGLTASVVKDARGEFYLEGGAMVLADGGIVAIDEFDKMRPTDRVAIHEAMEQQTISVAKAGITTVLNSRSSVLAAANPVFGRYDDLKSASENIDLMSTILSRFDLIFLVRDVRDEDRDRMICRHVMGVHIGNSGGQGGIGGAGGGLGAFGGTGVADGNGEDDFMAAGMLGGNNLQQAAKSSSGGNNNTPAAIAENAMRVATTGVGELDIPTMKKYIQYAKAKCASRLSEEAGDILASSYVKIRDDVRKRVMEAGGQSQAAIPITVRQLEALVRVSESLAKMRLDPQVQSEDIAEALRLFKVSTMTANSADQTNGNVHNASGAPDRTAGSMTGIMSAMPSRDELLRAETFLRSRLAIGSVLNKQKVVEEAAAQGYNAMVVARALSIMVSRGEVQERNQSRMVKRVR